MNNSTQGLVFLAIMIMIVCLVLLCSYCPDSDDRNNNNQPRASFQELISNIKSPRTKPTSLKSIPIVYFNDRGSKGPVECAVCLSDLAHGDKAKALPSCDHWFHVECIDTWFQSHSTCPICRNNMVAEPSPRIVASSDEVVMDIPGEARVREWPINVSYLNSL